MATSKAPGEYSAPVNATLIGQRTWPFLRPISFIIGIRASLSFSSVNSMSGRTSKSFSSARRAVFLSTFIFSC